MKYNLIYFFSIFTFLTFAVAQTNDATCDKCAKIEQCEMFQNMSPTQQYSWVIKYPCMKILYNGYFKPYEDGSYVCCSDKLWAAETGYGYNGDNIVDQPAYPKAIYWGDIKQPGNYQNHYGTGPSRPSVHSLNPVPKDPKVNIKPGGIDRSVTGQPRFNYNTVSPPFTANKEQCLASSKPPNPNTGCCGLEASASDRIMATSTARPVYTTPPYVFWPDKSTNTKSKAAEKTVNITIDTRIAGGHETNFYQFPWTVQLMATFDFEERRQSFDCGGSLISSRYVLTAGHCVYDAVGTLIKVDAFLAEYDRTTFPRDCKNIMSNTQECIENVVIAAEEVVRHPQYDDSKLLNDIALIRLRENAPYTALIRPICLTPIDVDDTNLANLGLAVAGWGRNGRYRSNIKQSTIVNLVHQEQCKKYYPHLIRSQMCAVGYSGEDTCKGDSGGPLMTLKGGKYYIVGIVSGKRADAPCGTAVPSLYTNVYHYLDWIFANIRN